MDMNILCLDIGSGTQDALFCQEWVSPRNWPKFVLPSPARRMGFRIRELTSRGSQVYFYGTNMGGGFKAAIKEHISQGLKVAAHPEAAAALSDSPEVVEGMGIALSRRRPPGYSALKLSDFEPGFWEALLAISDLPAPDLVLAAVQDHGYHPGESNRRGRFGIWERLLRECEGRPEELLFRDPPSELTRLRSLQESIGGGLVSDTGAAAALGALSDPEVEKVSREKGICVVNIGNSHTIAFLIFQGLLWGVYEHHTGMHSPGSLWRDIELFCRGDMSNEEVFQSGGHGYFGFHPPSGAEFLESVHVLGPNREMLSEYCASFPAPGGDMMLAGCFGLLHGLQLRRNAGDTV